MNAFRVKSFLVLFLFVFSLHFRFQDKESKTVSMLKVNDVVIVIFSVYSMACGCSGILRKLRCRRKERKGHVRFSAIAALHTHLNPLHRCFSSDRVCLIERLIVNAQPWARALSA